MKKFIQVCLLCLICLFTQVHGKCVVDQFENWTQKIRMVDTLTSTDENFLDSLAQLNSIEKGKG